jgi:hypothetical protein
MSQESVTLKVRSLWQRLAPDNREGTFTREEKIHAKCGKSMVAREENRRRADVCGSLGGNWRVRESGRGQPQKIRGRLPQFFAVVFITPVS